MYMQMEAGALTKEMLRLFYIGVFCVKISTGYNELKLSVLFLRVHRITTAYRKYRIKND